MLGGVLIVLFTLCAVRIDASVDSLMVVATDTTLSDDARVDLLKQAAKDDETGAAMHALGRLYMEIGGVSKVHSAERWLKRAINKDKENGTYLASLAEYFWRIGRRTTAITYAKRGIERDPNNVLPLYWAARFEMWEMTKTLDAEQVDYNYGDDARVTQVTFSLEKYGIEARNAAIGLLTRAVALAPDYWPIHHLLGLVYFEGRMEGELVALFEDYLERHADNVNAHFFLGLGYQAQDRLKPAFEQYREGLKQMAPQDQRFMMSVFVMADPDSTSPNIDGIRRFWTGRDPLYLTEYNERLLEHSRRVAYADLRFGDPLKGISGWHTDKGQAYIRYGHPISVVAHPAEFRTGTDLPGFMQDYLERSVQWQSMSKNYSFREELWRYDGFTLIFENTDTRDYWEYRIGWLDPEVNPLAFDTFIEYKPDHFVDPYKMKRYTAPYQLAQFRGKNGKSRVELYYGLPVDELTSEEDGRPGLRDVELKQGIFLFNANWDTLKREVVKVKKLPFVRYDALQEGYVFSGDRLQMNPGRHYLTAEIQDVATQSLGSFRDTLDVRSFAGNDLNVSDLLLARRVVEREKRPPGRDRYLVLSNPLRQYQRGSRAVVYFEVYNLQRDDFGGTHYELTFQVRALSDANDLDDAEWTTAVSYEQRGNRDWEPLYLALELKKVMPGPKALRVLVKDLQSEQMALTMTAFRVMW
ncbi:MAG: GWxTD domain-containing protein [Candidatus Latescibacteria bacterium]|nr:GWxTD domain-containing protein [Candidatus Latescibacterota bacterium]